MDLHIGTVSMNSPTLEVACPPPEIGTDISKNVFYVRKKTWKFLQ
jgi:hypothetical protein